MRKTKPDIRAIAAITAMCLTLAVFAGTLFKIQLVDGDKYAQAGKYISVKKVDVSASRGEILDRNGNALVTNRQGNSVIFDYSYFPSAKEQDKRNQIIIALIRLFEQEGQEWVDNLPIHFNSSGLPVFDAEREKDIDELRGKDYLKLNEYATAQNCMDALIERYNLSKYSAGEARKIASVCYEMKRTVFSANNPFTIAEDVPTQLIAKIKENSAFFIGVDVSIVPYREYTDGKLLPHVLGMVGLISAEEYAEAKESGEIKYALNDTIGKSGIEASMEKYLRGTNGIKTVTTDAEGGVSTDYEIDPVQGNTVILTIDKNLQQVANDALSSGLEKLREDSVVSPAGAIVIEDVNSGELLASASYPSYDISTYRENYSALSAQPNAPLWNRVTMSTYSPGSTMKPCTALAALEEHVITKNTYFRCTRSYTYLDHTFQCLQKHAHLTMNVVSAINESCNIFFYETGKNLGISKLVEYASILGLGQKTGVEIAEVSGTLDSVEYRASLGQDWQPGFTLQNAIGNGGSMFTPIQLVNYCSTIANGGTRYQPHYVKSVKSADYSSTLLENGAKLVLETGFSAENIATVQQGMKLVGTVGYCKTAFQKLPVTAAAKTGTSQVDRKINGVTKTTNNGFLITYAPADNPQIAICIAAEGAGSGSSLAPIAAAVYDYYFTKTGNLDTPQAENELLY